MDNTKIMRFLSLARKNLDEKMFDADLDLKKTVLLPEFVQGNLIYKSSFKGTIEISGKEIILCMGKLAWARYFKGGVTDSNLSLENLNELRAFLKEAISHFPNSNPYERGPKEYSLDLFDYKNSCTGDFEKFSGKEEIFLKGKKVYELTYFGGTR